MRWDRNYKEPEPINDPVIIPAYGVTDEERAYWNKKQEAIEYDDYPRRQSDKLLISGTVWQALEDYKVQAVDAAQKFFWGHANGIEQSAQRCEIAVVNAVDAESHAAASETNAATSAFNAASSAADANAAAVGARNSEVNAASSELNSLNNSYDAEAWAKGTRNGVPVDENDPTWHNNAEYYVTVMPTLIDDELVSQYLTWSSYKLNELFDEKADLVEGKVPAAQLPSYVDDVVEGYYNTEDHLFYEEDTFETPILGESGKIYLDSDTSKTYRWSGSVFAEISASLALGETASTAYAGNKGKVNADNIASILEKIPGTASSSNLLATQADIPTDLSELDQDSAHRLVSDDDLEYWDNKADGEHTHDDRYYTEQEINTMFAGVTFTEETDGIYINW